MLIIWLSGSRNIPPHDVDYIIEIHCGASKYDVALSQFT